MKLIELASIRKVYRFGISRSAWEHVPEEDNHFLAYKLFGRTVHEYGGETHVFTKDMVMVANSGEAYRVTSHMPPADSKRGDCIAVHFSTYAPMSPQISMMSCASCPQMRGEFFRLLDSWNQYTATGNAADHYACISHFYAILQLLMLLMDQQNAQMNSDRRLILAREYLERNYSNSALSVSDAAEAAGLSVRRLNDLFTRRFHTTPGRYLTDVRLRAAVKLLSESAGIADIAALTGYASASYFIRVFHREMGVSPAAYREKTK